MHSRYNGISMVLPEIGSSVIFLHHAQGMARKVIVDLTTNRQDIGWLSESPTVINTWIKFDCNPDSPSGENRTCDTLIHGLRPLGREELRASSIA